VPRGRGKPTRLTRNLRRLLEGYLAALVFLVSLGVGSWILGGDVGGFLDSVVWSGLFLATIAWLVVAYFAGASPETYLQPDQARFVMLSRSGPLILPQDNPEVMKDLKDKLVGNQSDVMLWAGGNAVLCFGLGILFYFAPLVTIIGLVAIVVAIGLVLLRSR
jgi:hypothetical protein